MAGVPAPAAGVEQLVQGLQARGFAELAAGEMREKLLQRGATRRDLEEWPAEWRELPPDPVYHRFRFTTMSRFRAAGGGAERLERAPFQLDYNNNKKLGSLPRDFPEPAPSFLCSRATQAAVRLVAETTHAAWPQEPAFVLGVHQFKIVSLPGGEQGSPTPEGVHHDGAWAVFIIYIEGRNLAANAGQSRVYSLQQPLGPIVGPEREAEAQRNRLLARTMREPCHALVLADRQVKHDNLPVEPEEPGLPAERCVLVIWARPPQEGEPLGPHPTWPLAVGPTVAADAPGGEVSAADDVAMAAPDGTLAMATAEDKASTPCNRCVSAVGASGVHALQAA